MSEVLTIVAVGDLVPSRRLFDSDFGQDNDFADVVNILRDADITFGNLEIPLSESGYPKEKLIAFRAKPEIVQDLRQAGFNILALANNHSLDYGYEALFDTMHGLDEQGILHVGAGRNLDESLAPALCTEKGLTIGVLAFTSLLPTGAAASEQRPGLAPIHVHVAYEVNPYFEMEEPGNKPNVKTWADSEELKTFEEQIRLVKSQVDFLIVSAHWGFGAGEELAEYQRPLAHALIDAGADVVFGNHVHAVHGVEVYGGKAILYSPGNFIAQQPRENLTQAAEQLLDEMSTDAYLAQLDLHPTGTYSVRLVPITTDASGLPQFATGEDLDRITETLHRLSADLDTKLEQMDEGMVVMGLG